VGADEVNAGMVRGYLKNIILGLILILIFPNLPLNAEEPSGQAASSEEQSPSAEEKTSAEEQAPAEENAPAEEQAPAEQKSLSQESPDMQLVFKSETKEGALGDEIFKQAISLDLRNIDIVEALKFLAMKTGLNLVCTKAVTGRATLTVENVLIRDVFDIMLRSNSLAYDKTGEIYTVMTEGEYKALYGKTFFDTREVKVFRLKYAIPEQAFTLLEALKSEIGRLVVDPESGNVLVMDTPEKVKQMQKSLEEFEKKNTVEVFNLKYAKAKDVEDTLKTQLDSKKVGSVKSDERTNQIIVQTLPERMEEIRGLIKNLDAPTKEVLIDTKVIKINLSNQLDESVEWEGILSLGRKYGMTYLGSYPFSEMTSTSAATWESREQVYSALGSIGSYPFSGTTSNYSASQPSVIGQSIHLGSITTKRDYDTFMQFVQTLGKTRILSNPKLVVVNNQEAKIHVGEKQAYVTTTTTTGQTTSTIAEQVTFVDVGIQLSVIPTINDDGFITMKVKPEISSVVSTLITPTNNRIPIIDTSMIETTVLIKDGTTLIIGGLRKDEKTSSSMGLPILSKIPFLGSVFKSATGTSTRTELLVMLTPHIISGTGLTTGDERAFGDKPGKEYEDYKSLAPQGLSTPGAGLENKLPPGIEVKPYQDYLGAKEGGAEEIPIKEKRYGLF
jgi:type II secretory pathway component GspD/PulD (secretin)